MDHYQFKSPSKMQSNSGTDVVGGNEWLGHLTNGGLGVKRPTSLVGMGPSPSAVNFLKEELGYSSPPRSANLEFLSHSSQASKISAFDGYGYIYPRTGYGANVEMRELMSLSSPVAEGGDIGFQASGRSEEKQAMRALADLFACPATTFPLSVGLFHEIPETSITQTPQASSLDQLQDDIGLMLRRNVKTLPTFSAAIIVAPAVTIFIAAYLLAITVKYEVGLSLGILGLFIQFFFLMAVAIGKECFNMRLAWSASFVLSSFVRQISLFTKFLFYYPRRKFSSMSPVRLQTVSYRLSLSPNTPHFVLMLLQLMWTAMENNYNPLVVRLQRFMHQSTLPLSSKRKYKRICCLPAFVVVILVGVSILIDLLLLRIFDFNAIVMLTDLRALPIFVMMSSIIFLGFCASVPSIANALFAYLYRPKTPLMKAINTYATKVSQSLGKKKPGLFKNLAARVPEDTTEKTNGDCLQKGPEFEEVLPITSTCEVDILAKKEFANICDMLQAFNYYLQTIEQTRLLVLIDATEATSAVQLAGVFYQVHSLLLTQPTAPIGFVIAANIYPLLEKPSVSSRPNEMVFHDDQSGACNEALNLLRSIGDCNHLLLFSIQLPIFMDAKSVNDDPSALKRFLGAGSIHALLENCSNATPVTSNVSTGLGEEDGVAGSSGLVTARTKTSVAGNAGQINKAFTSIEELGHDARETMIESNATMKGAHSTSSLAPQTTSQRTASAAGDESEGPSTMVKSVNSSRLSAVRAGARGVAEVFLATEDMAEQNVPVIRTLVAETAFTNRLLNMSSAPISIKQLTNWIYLTQHWPFHMAWMMNLLLAHEEDVVAVKQSVQTTISSPTKGQSCVLPTLITKTLEEISVLPPISTVLSGDDCDPSKLLQFVQTQLDCPFSRGDLKHLMAYSLFLCPIFRLAIKEIRSYFFGETTQSPDDRDLEKKFSNSGSAVTSAQLAGPKTDFYKSNAVPESIATLPQCINSEFNNRNQGALGASTNDSSGDTRSPLPVSFDSESNGKTLCYANSVNMPIFPQCPIRLKCNVPIAELSKLGVDDVCLLVSAISGIPAGNCSSYQMQIRRQNINGQVLSVCDLMKLRKELQMSFGDWQLFNTFVTYLRRVEASLLERSRSGQVAAFGDTKSHHGSVAVASPYPYSQVLLSPSSLVLCNEQSHCRSKTMFDVPVLVQQVSLENNTLASSARPNTDRTTSDFSFGSGTDEIELAWRRDAQPDSLNDNACFQKPLTARQMANHSNFNWVGSSADRLSKSTHDLTLPGTSVRTRERQASSRSNDDAQFERSARKSDLHGRQPVPAFVSQAPDSGGMIPVWCPTLPCLGESNRDPHHSRSGDVSYSESSSVSMDGTYDFPSEYSSGDRHCQQRQGYRHHCPPDCPRSHRERRRRKSLSRPKRSSSRAEVSSSRRNSVSKGSKKSNQGCTCDYFLCEGDDSGGSITAVNPWTTRSPRKVSSPDLSDIEAMTSS